MNEKTVMFNDIADVAEFVDAAEKCEFDVDVFSGNQYVDAKSLLGVMSMGFERRLQVLYRDHDTHFEKELQKFCVA